SILITAEGVNSTIAGSREAIDSFMGWLETEITHGPITWKESLAEFVPFGKARVRLKKETISLGEPVSMTKFGDYVEPKDWNDLIRRNDVVNLGTFRNAVDPGIGNFKQLPAWVRDNAEALKGKKLATFCTGGIRCEKFTSWLVDQGFEEVYHLKGGILKYFEDVPVEQSLWD